MLRASTASVPHAASADCCHMNTPSELSLRGINIQYPFSRLILFGVKTVEVRTYPLGDRNLGGDNEDLFLIETPGIWPLDGKKWLDARLDDAHCDEIWSREGALKDPLFNGTGLQLPHGPQAIGIIRFSWCGQFFPNAYGRHYWNGMRSKHRIKAFGRHDWNGKGQMYGWYVDKVQPFSTPIPADELSWRDELNPSSTLRLTYDVEVAAADDSADDAADDVADKADNVALVVEGEWLNLILQGHKTWEIRGTPTKKRQVIQLARSGSGLLLGQARITDCLRIDLDDMAKHNDKHCMCYHTYPKIYAWVLKDVKKHAVPKPYKHPHGAINWVNRVGKEGDIRWTLTTPESAESAESVVDTAL